MFFKNKRSIVYLLVLLLLLNGCGDWETIVYVVDAEFYGGKVNSIRGKKYKNGIEYSRGDTIIYTTKFSHRKCFAHRVQSIIIHTDSMDWLSGNILSLPQFEHQLKTKTRSDIYEVFKVKIPFKIPDKSKLVGKIVNVSFSIHYILAHRSHGIAEYGKYYTTSGTYRTSEIPVKISDY